MTSPSHSSRTPLIDALKALAAQLIVLHHLAFYGPLSDVVHERSPLLIDWLYDYARMAVQIFIVVGGFLAARSLTSANESHLLRPIQPFQQLGRRYMRLVPPYLGALLVAIIAAAIARTLMLDDSIPAEPTLMQFLSHVLLLNDLLDQDALSTGVWYVAIDIQLFVIFVVCIWLTQTAMPRLRARFSPIADSHSSRGRYSSLKVLVGVLAAASLLYFNRSADWDDWGVYFFGAYALGALAYWAANARSPRWILVPLALGVVALIIEMRLRIAVAMCTAMVLCLAHRYRHFAPGSPHGLVHKLGQSSYSLFLVHFPVCLVVNGLIHKLAPGAYWPSVAGLVLAWCLSNVAGMVYYLHVERNMSAWLTGLSAGFKSAIRARRAYAAASLRRGMQPGTAHFLPVDARKAHAGR